MQLNKDDIKILTDLGCTQEDISQIKRLRYNFTLYYKNGNKTEISLENAKRISTIKHFLAGIERAAFHRSGTIIPFDKKEYEYISVESNL